MHVYTSLHCCHVSRPVSAPPARPCWSAHGAFCAWGRRRCETASPSPRQPDSARWGRLVLLLVSLAVQRTGWVRDAATPNAHVELRSRLLLLLLLVPQLVTRAVEALLRSGQQKSGGGGGNVLCYGFRNKRPSGGGARRCC